MINKMNFETDVWFISMNEPYQYGKLEAGLFLTSKEYFYIFDNEEDYLAKIDELGIVIGDELTDELNLEVNEII